MSASASPLLILVDGTPKPMVANAMWPLEEIWPGARYGLVTTVTCGARANGASAPVTRARTAGEVMGAADSMASVSVSPDCRAKCWFSSVCPGSLPVKSSCAAAPNLVHSVMSAATPATHTSTVTQRWR